MEASSLHNHHTKPLLPKPDPAMLHHHLPAADLIEPPPAPSLTRPPDLDETDYSTSFADTASSNHNNSATVSDAEVDSQFSNDGNGFSAPSFDDFGTVLRVRKKRLTSHWRSFIRPLMWRCKWAELKIKQFESQALEYAKKVAARNATKHLASNQSIPEGFSSRSMPYTKRRQRKLMKRRKRARIEDTTDADLYMSQHVLFSYNESKKSDQDEVSVLDDFDDPEQNTPNPEVHGLGMQNHLSFFEDEDNEMEHILHKIETTHSRVHKLKSQLELVFSENSQMFPFSENENNLGPSEEQTRTVHSPTFSNSEFDMGGLEMYEHEGFHIPDIIESTVGTLSSIDVTQHQSQFGDSCEKILDNMLVHDETTEAEKQALRNNQQHPITVKQEDESAMESDTATKDVVQEQSSVKPFSEFQIPINKRKRGERKAGTSKWNIQLPGEPDSQ
ncbi:hypothetical protein HanPI659440_Chr01g0028841 [Helianthus annuus]|nr:hypothetical protein HanHA300_Chr01g0028571 [Helianthus annuus]KAJ0784172.1 hypothetical protein HanLR1_Chr01g0029261 [Helianthus annuus]KAJ0810601.1 hypothetical protein HanPI659440_Chr01g0028841 [Helianthus annuus]